MASLNSARQKAINVRVSADMRELNTAIQLYYDKYGYYPHERDPAVVTALSDPGTYEAYSSTVVNFPVVYSAADLRNSLQPLVDNGFISEIPTLDGLPSGVLVFYKVMNTKTNPNVVSYVDVCNRKIVGHYELQIYNYDGPQLELNLPKYELYSVLGGDYTDTNPDGAYCISE